MAITVSIVALHRAGFGIMDFTINSNKHLSEIKAVSGIGNSSGNTALTVSGIGTFEAGDVAVLTLGTTNFDYLNGTWNVVSTASNTIVIDCPFQAATTGTKPTATRTNTGIKEKVVIQIGAVVVATFYVYPVLSGSDFIATVDIAPYLQGYFTTSFKLAPDYYPTPSNHLITYTCKVWEMNLKADLTYYTAAAGIDLEADGSKKYLYAHRCAVLRVCDAGTPNNQLLTDFKTQYFNSTDLIMLSALLTTKTTAKYHYTGGLVNIPNDSDEETITNFYFNATVQINAFIIPFAVQVGNAFGEAGQWTSETITFVKDDKCKAYPVTMYFMNRYGGFDIYHFKETASDKFIVEKWKNKTMQNVTATTREKKLIGRPETYANLQVLSDLISSPEVYDTAGNMIYIKSSDMILKDGDEVVYPEITIEIFENEFING